MTKDRAVGEVTQPAITEPTAEGEPEDDTEGHFMLPGSGGERELSSMRRGEIDRSVRERSREKEARVNRPKSR